MAAPIQTRLGEPIVLLASAAHAGAGSGSEAAYGVPPLAQVLLLVLDVTDCKTDSGDKLDVSIQTKLDNNEWLDICAFTQLSGNGTDDLTYVAKLNAATALTMFERGSALTAGNIRNMWGQELRVHWIVTDSGTADASFTFSVSAVPL